MTAAISYRSRALAALGVLLPVPLLAAAGLSLPLPTIVERLAAKLVPFGDAAVVGREAAPAEGTIVKVRGERAGMVILPTSSAPAATTAVGRHLHTRPLPGSVSRSARVGTGQPDADGVRASTAAAKDPSPSGAPNAAPGATSSASDTAAAPAPSAPQPAPAPAPTQTPAPAPAPQPAQTPTQVVNNTVNNTVTTAATAVNNTVTTAGNTVNNTVTTATNVVNNTVGGLGGKLGHP